MGWDENDDVIDDDDYNDDVTMCHWFDDLYSRWQAAKFSFTKIFFWNLLSKNINHVF